MMEAVKNGANRQELHERIRQISMLAWDQMDKQGSNPLENLLKNDKIITRFVEKKAIPRLIDPTAHIGLAHQNCLIFLRELEKEIS